MVLTRVISLTVRMIVNKCMLVVFFVALGILELQILRSNAPTHQHRESGKMSVIDNNANFITSIVIVLVFSVVLNLRGRCWRQYKLFFYGL